MAGTLDMGIEASFDVGGAEDRRPMIHVALEAMAFDHETVIHSNITGAVTDQDLLDGTVTSAKVVLVSADLGEGVIKMNGGTGVPVNSAGGWLCFANPNGGVTTLSVTTTDDAKFKVFLFE